MSGDPRRFARFETIELDLRAGELRRDGSAPTPLSDQPFQILVMLLRRAGDVVTRDEIRQALWPNGTIVEFEHSISAAMNRLRQALGDSPQNPRYIETLARRGYRWKTAVHWVESPRETIAEEPKEQRRLAANTGNLTGKKVSRFRVLEVLGGGGMGVVYKAEDLRLGRQVALKFLPDDLASDPRAVERFEREARSASALSHPNICTIYEVGEHEGQPFIVMELLQGETLREVISVKPANTPPLALPKLLDLAVQIAKGLEAAHREGIVHRDIKPANIFVTDQGQAKILDFGLAKPVAALTPETSLVRSEERSQELSHPVTPKASSGKSLLLSRTGAAMGTEGYMSPEQIRGEKLDARTDLFSFGLVLFEMATGQRAFERNTAPALQSAILTESPVSARVLNPGLPPKFEQIISKALEKGRDSRYQKASDLAADLEVVRRGLERKNRFRWAAIVGASVSALLIVGTVFWAEKRKPAPMPTPPAIQFRQLTINSSDDPVTSGALSPNGKYLAYVDAQGMHVKDIDTNATQAIAEPSDVKKDSTTWEVIDLGWFPDNTRFVANAHPVGEYQLAWSARTSDIWIFSRLNQAPQKVRGSARAYSVSPDGSLIAFGANTLWPSSDRRVGEREVWLMGANGDQARKAFETDQNGAMSGFLWSPESQRGIFFNSDASDSTLLSRDIHGGAPTTLLSSDEIPKVRGDLSWLPDGRVIYQAAETGSQAASACNFWAMRVDVRTGELIEKPKRLTNWTGFCSSNANVTADGKRLAFLQSSAEHGTAYVADLEAGETRIRNLRHFTLEEEDEFIGDWTADSKAVIVGAIRDNDHYGVFKQSLDSGNSVPIVSNAEGGFLAEAILSPDRKWVIGLVWPPVGGPSPSNPSAPLPLVRIPVAGGAPEPIFQVVRPGPYSCARAPSNLCVVPELTPDQKQVTVTAFDPIKGRGAELARFDLDRDMNLSEHNLLCVLSPDGTRIAFARGPNGPIEIHSLRRQPTFLIHANGLDKLWNIQWAADSKALLVAKKVRDGTELLHVDMQGKTTRLWKSIGPRCYGIPSPDGRHLAVYDWKRSANMWLMENF